jgi:hypothetical protein
MSSEVFFKWQRRIFTTIFNRSFNCLPDGQKKISIYIRNFLKKSIFFYNIISFSPRPFVNVIIPKSFLIIESKTYHSWDWNIYSETLASYVFCMYFHSITSN